MPQNILEDINLKIEAGETVGIIGGTGSSKTTLVQLIPRLYDTTEGQVLVGGRDVREYDIEALRGNVAMVLQKNELFSGTIRDNLLLVAPDADEAQRQEALRAAAADFVFELAQGEESHVGENNTGLSKGQLQRIAIARAILMQRSVLLLDECTSALDAQTERQVLERLRLICPSAILVTHRPEALEEIPGVKAIRMEE